LNEGRGKITRRNQEQLVLDWKLDIAELCAVQGYSIVEHHRDGCLETLPRIKAAGHLRKHKNPFR